MSFNIQFYFVAVYGVTVTEVHIISINSGRSDYVILGEAVQLSCHYILTKEEEKIVSVSWEKDGENVSQSSLSPSLSLSHQK